MTPFELPPAMAALADDDAALRRHADQILANGFTVIPGALPAPLIVAMRERFDPILEAHRQAESTNRGAHRYQMYLPFEAPFSSPLLTEHPVALKVIGKVLGERFLLNYFASDTPFPGSDYQAVHSDGEALFPGVAVALPVFALVLNVSLVDVTEENGPMEIWPGGTHLIASPVDVARTAEGMVSQRLTIRAGDILLRDPRAWHRGTPNRGTRSRPNLALLYARPWFRFGLDLPTVRRSEFDGLGETTKAMLRYANLVD